MKAQAMAAATSMARKMRKTIRPHEGPRGVACGSGEFWGVLAGEFGVEPLGGTISSSVRRPTPNGVTA
jgi:hypothetical protein